MPQDVMRKLKVRTQSQIDIPIIVNSFGRSGSTVLYKAVRDSALKPLFRDKHEDHGLGGQAWILDETRTERGRAYKSHDRAAKRLPGDAKMFYVFGEPVAATLSVMKRGYKRQDWFDLHCDHMRVPHCAPDDLIEDDALRIEEHLQGWLDSPATPVAFVRYEAMWDYVEEMSEFIGFPLELPPQRERSSRAEDAPAALVDTYASTARLVDSLPDWHVRE
ncbi:hypothetical protein [Demequina sp. NBRC 110056]|uniref:hypothetical protein n=1 Tax=Demequina sp. NBRC 110056 TaxID=1570345 RepID=UPI00135634A3|nr:hypothetical protein [Demequina sp. NBRC 110056]